MVDLPGPREVLIYTKSPIFSTAISTNIAADMTREEGKTLPEAKGEVRRSINIFRYFAGEGSGCSASGAVGTRSCTHVRAAETDRRRGTGDAVELPERRSPRGSLPPH